MHNSRSSSAILIGIKDARNRGSTPSVHERYERRKSTQGKVIAVCPSSSGRGLYHETTTDGDKSYKERRSSHSRKK